MKTSTAAGAGLFVAPYVSNAKVPKQKSEKENVNIAFIGVGGRGRTHLKRVAITEGVNITAICDIDPLVISKSQKILRETGHPEAVVYSD